MRTKAAEPQQKTGQETGQKTGQEIGREADQKAGHETGPHLKIVRHFTEGFASGGGPLQEDSKVFEMFEWELKDSEIMASDGREVFSAKNLEFPLGWSQNAANIVAQKYFHLPKETSLKQMTARVVNTITKAGLENDYFTEAAAEIFADELAYLLVAQMASFNSPVWFNIGLEGRAQQSSACFILSVDDSLDSILNWISEEGKIFKGGSGSGVNLSNIRASNEKLSGGGIASGPVSFMRGADSSAGAIRSGGTTRRAAKMVVLDADHPDISEFIWCKALEERKSRALEEAGFSMGVDGIDKTSIQFQNANNSVRLTREFFEAVENDGDWELKNRQDSKTAKTVKARQLLADIANASWECADPGVQYDSTINLWHTAPKAGRISASNPCSEYFHLDNSACNLASLNLLSFLKGIDLDEVHLERIQRQNQAENQEGSKKEGSKEKCGSFDVEGFKQAVSIMITAQEILVGYSDYPTIATGETARAYRQLGLGYTNLGALLMSMGMAYDSPEARDMAGGITALMTGQAYFTSALIAADIGPFEGCGGDWEDMLRVLDMHSSALDSLMDSAAHSASYSGVHSGSHSGKAQSVAGLGAAAGLEEILLNASRVWSKAVELARIHGVRNSQATVLAPTGTISFMMDCDTTGIEPDLSLIKIKQLVGGGTMKISNQSVRNGLEALGYGAESIPEILEHIANTGSIAGAPNLLDDHEEVFACAMGDNPISPRGHILMMSAVQPFISGGISKTVNLPSDVSPDEIAELIMEGHRLGLKALAIYRDNSKVSQPLVPLGESDAAKPKAEDVPRRKSLPRSRNSRTFEFEMSGCKGYVTVGEYEDGRPGEIFIRVSKQGSTLSGIMDAFAIAISHGLQYGVPLVSYIDAYRGMRFEPIGITDDEELRFASSIIDYIFRRLALMYLSREEREKFNIYTSLEREQLSLPINGNAGPGSNSSPGFNGNGNGSSIMSPNLNTSTSNINTSTPVEANAPLCHSCGHVMVRSGSCHTCMICGSTSGCS